MGTLALPFGLMPAVMLFFTTLPIFLARRLGAPRRRAKASPAHAGLVG